MIKRSYIYLSFIILSLLTGCVEKSGYYDDGQQEIIDNLTKNEGWERSYHMTSYDGRECDVYELWVFKSDATGSRKFVWNYDDGEVSENMGYFRWSFTIPNFKIIYMDSGLYWEIKQLTTDKLHIYETYDDPITVPGNCFQVLFQRRVNITEAGIKNKVAVFGENRSVFSTGKTQFHVRSS